MKRTIRWAALAAAAMLAAPALAAPSLAAPQKAGKKAGGAGKNADGPGKKGGGPGKKGGGAPAPSDVAAAGTTASSTAGTAPGAAEPWYLDVPPYAVFGSGHPGKAAADFDKPDGVAFTPNGYLLATDAKNRRVQVWDVRTKTRLGDFGKKFFGGEIVDVAVAPDGVVYVTDQTLNLAYMFVPPAPGATDKETGRALEPWEYQFKGTRFGEQGFDKLGGIATDTAGRIYVVDAHLNEVRRFTRDAKPDPTWHFEKSRPDGNTYLHGCEGIAINEQSGDLYVSSEKDAVVQVFDRETGAYRGKMIGAAQGAVGVPSGRHVFAASVEGLSLAGGRLFAVDESVGHIQIFDLSGASAFNASLDSYGAGKARHGYLGYVGHSPIVNFEDKTNTALQQQVKDGAVIPGQANPPGYFCSPDSVATWVEPGSGETYIAVADQCNYRIAVYRWSDVARVIHPGGGDGPAGPGGKKKGKKGGA